MVLPLRTNVTMLRELRLSERHLHPTKKHRCAVTRMVTISGFEMR